MVNEKACGPCDAEKIERDKLVSQAREMAGQPGGPGGPLVPRGAGNAVDRGKELFDQAMKPVRDLKNELLITAPENRGPIRAKLGEWNVNTPRMGTEKTFFNDVLTDPDVRSYALSLDTTSYSVLRDEVLDAWGGDMARQMEKTYKKARMDSIGRGIDAMKARGMDTSKAEELVKTVDEIATARSEGLLQRRDLEMLDQADQYVKLNGDTNAARKRLAEIENVMTTTTGDRQIELIREKNAINGAFEDKFRLENARTILSNEDVPKTTINEMKDQMTAGRISDETLAKANRQAAEVKNAMEKITPDNAIETVNSISDRTVKDEVLNRMMKQRYDEIVKATNNGKGGLKAGLTSDEKKLVQEVMDGTADYNMKNAKLAGSIASKMDTNTQKAALNYAKAAGAIGKGVWGEHKLVIFGLAGVMSVAVFGKDLALWAMNSDFNTNYKQVLEGYRINNKNDPFGTAKEMFENGEYENLQKELDKMEQYYGYLSTLFIIPGFKEWTNAQLNTILEEHDKHTLLDRFMRTSLGDGVVRQNDDGSWRAATTEEQNEYYGGHPEELLKLPQDDVTRISNGMWGGKTGPSGETEERFGETTLTSTEAAAYALYKDSAINYQTATKMISEDKIKALDGYKPNGDAAKEWGEDVLENPNTEGATGGTTEGTKGKETVYDGTTPLPKDVLEDIANGKVKIMGKAATAIEVERTLGDPTITLVKHEDGSYTLERREKPSGGGAVPTAGMGTTNEDQRRAGETAREVGGLDKITDYRTRATMVSNFKNTDYETAKKELETDAVGLKNANEDAFKQIVTNTVGTQEGVKKTSGNDIEEMFKADQQATSQALYDAYCEG